GCQHGASIVTRVGAAAKLITAIDPNARRRRPMIADAQSGFGVILLHILPDLRASFATKAAANVDLCGPKSTTNEWQMFFGLSVCQVGMNGSNTSMSLQNKHH